MEKIDEVGNIVMQQDDWEKHIEEQRLKMYKDPDYRPEDMLRDLLATIHGDGGHHTEEVGLEQSVIDAGYKTSELKDKVRDLTSGNVL